MKTPSPLPRSTTFVSPVTRGAPTAAQASAIEATIRSRSFMGKPSSSTRPALKKSGSAPHMARSLAVPWTASEPMSPPGKKRGCTTKVSVVKARRSAPTGTTAPSPRAARYSLRKAGRKTRSMRDDVFLPPPPCASWTMSPWPKGVGQVSMDSTVRDMLTSPRRGQGRPIGPPVVEVGGAGPFGRRPWSRPCGCSGVQRVPNSGQSVGLSRPCSTRPARHSSGSRAERPATSKTLLRVEAGVAGREGVSAPGDLARARAICGPRPRTRPRACAARRGCRRAAPPAEYSFTTRASPASSCRTAASTPRRMSRGSKPVTTIGTR